MDAKQGLHSGVALLCGKVHKDASGILSPDSQVRVLHTNQSAKVVSSG